LIEKKSSMEWQGSSHNNIAFEMIDVVAAGFYSGIVQSTRRHREFFFSYLLLINSASWLYFFFLTADKNY